MECTDATRYITTGLCSAARERSTGGGAKLYFRSRISRKLPARTPERPPISSTCGAEPWSVKSRAVRTATMARFQPATALFIACGQDVANVVNSAASITLFDETAEGACT